jgi:hypothetical protein
MSAVRRFFLSAGILLAGIAIGAGGTVLLARGNGAKLNADLSSAQWSLETATRTNAELTGELRQLHGELNRANGIAKDQQSRLDRQKQIIDGILGSIDFQGGNIRSQIRGIADGFRRLYDFYN